ncbi:MAG: PaaI family thioesterase [Clostridia bacterium]|nr:PaaI family thioesterase [Clostridia bacterium]
MSEAARSLEEMRACYTADRFAIEAVGAQIDSCGDGFAVCSLDIRPVHVNGHGMVMGGVSFTLADFAFAVACDAMRTGAVTLSSSVQYLSAPKGTRLIAEARRVREGRTACFYAVTVRDDLGRHIAEVSITGHKPG